MRALVAALMIATAVTRGFAEDTPPLVSVQAAASPEHPTIGSHIRYTVDVVYPPGIEVVVAQPAERIGDLEIVDFGSAPPKALPDGRMSLERWWSLVAWSTGDHAVTSPDVSYRAQGGEPQSVPAAQITIQVASLLDQTKDAADIRDIKPPEPIPIDWRPYYAAAAVLVGAAALFAGARWLARRRKRAATAAPPLPPHVLALSALDALRARRLVEQGAFKEYYSTLTDIVRAYLEGRFHVRAPEMTTEEFLVASSRDGRLAAVHRRLLGEFLTESDLVKFARHRPSTDDSERAYDAARRFVDETMEREEGEARAAG
jgi:hypothetical protein